MDSWKQVLVSVAVGVGVGVLAARWSPPVLWPLVTWSATAAVYLVWVWHTSWPCDAERTRRLARREDPSRKGTDLFLMVASVISLGAVAVALTGSTSGQMGTRALSIALGLLTIVLSWGLINTVFALTYARQYYEAGGGIDFNTEDPPAYSDFAYLAFSVGMATGVTDTSTQSTAIRRTALAHQLLSYLFGTGILAVAVSLVPNLAP
ncbi:DUF1345 domain-containing protein [Blastococcus sp. TF02A-30]|nr:DUF1345 domain-containing protein [Blastococcus sp. TF02A-30]